MEQAGKDADAPDSKATINLTLDGKNLAQQQGAELAHRINVFSSPCEGIALRLCPC